MKNTKKVLSVVLCFVLVASMALFAAGCGSDEVSIPVTDGQTVGKGDVSFPLVIVDGDGNEVNVTVNTDKEIVGEALLELGLVEGEDSDYGLFIKTVNGITADYDVDGTYWAFYINDEYAMAGVDSTPSQRARPTC